MKLLTKNIREKLLRNGRLKQKLAEQGRNDADFVPVVKLFTPDATCAWLLTELDPDDQNIAFGLCDLGLGYPELGSVSIAEIKALRGQLGLPVERDIYFQADKPLSIFAKEARENGFIKV